MSTARSGEASGLLHLANRQLLLCEERRKMVARSPAEKPSASFRFVTISRDIGALGDIVASELGQRVGWSVYDKEIVDYIARDSHVRQSLVDRLDERAQNRIHDTIFHFLTAFGNDEYHGAVFKTLAALAAQERVILLGRGGAFVLQKQPGLHVRVTASLPLRVERMSKLWNLPASEARRRVVAVDAERRSFLRYHFDVDPEDLRFYHVVLNTDSVTVNQAVKAIAVLLASASADDSQTRTGMLEFRSSDRDTTVSG